MSYDLSATKSPGAIDSSQLLTLCFTMRENMSSLRKSISMAQLRLTTLNYVHEDSGDWSLKCSDNLIELCNLSQLVVQLLDQLHLKLQESSENSIHYQIASQQLMFFTSEWYDDITPKLNETYELAYKQDMNIIGRDQGVVENNQTGINYQMSASEIRIRDALLRLKESMRENERLIAGIASNIEYTKATIESIYTSLQSTKLSLNAGEHNAIEAIKILRQSNKTRLILYFCLLVLIALTAYYLFSLFTAN